MYCKYPLTTLWHLFSTLFLVSLKTFYLWKHCRLAESYFAIKGLYSQSYGFSSSLVRMWELDHKEGWVPKNWCFWTVVLEKTLESPVVSKEIQPVTPKGGQPWIFIGRASAEAEAPILWPPDAKSYFTGKDPDPGKDSGQEAKWMDRGWECWMASLTQWTWVWAHFGR